MGLGTTMDWQQAFAWYKKSADQNNPNGQYCVGCCYQMGIGVQPDLQQAIQWFRKSAALNNPMAKVTLAMLGQN
jgi:TPR repeat protein